MKNFMSSFSRTVIEKHTFLNFQVQDRKLNKIIDQANR